MFYFVFMCVYMYNCILVLKCLKTVGTGIILNLRLGVGNLVAFTYMVLTGLTSV